MIKTHHLSAGYKSGNKARPLFQGLDLALERGKLVCFMGPNGIGKSTLIRTLAGLQKPLAGKVVYGENHRPLSHFISVVLTDSLSNVNMTVRELLTTARYPYTNWTIQLNDDDLHTIQRAAHLTRTEDLLDRKLTELSDGQRQLASIARAIAQNGDVLLLDEPTAHLDLNHRVTVMDMLRTLAREENKAILLATHELDLALQTADEVWLAGNNAIITGLPEDLVLNGAFDDIFRFKGFDLKTGRITHEARKTFAVSLTGEGPAFLWTKNALERSGYEVSSHRCPYHIETLGSNGNLSWALHTPNGKTEHPSIAQLMEGLGRG